MRMLRFQTYVCQELSNQLVGYFGKSCFLDLCNSIRELSCKEKMVKGDKIIFQSVRRQCGLLKERCCGEMVVKGTV